MQSAREDTLQELYALKFCFKHGKNATETFGKLQTTFGPSCMNRESAFESHKRLKEGRQSVWEDERCGRSKEVNTPKLILFTNPSARAGYDTRSIIKLSLTGLNSDFSFS